MGRHAKPPKRNGKVKRSPAHKSAKDPVGRVRDLEKRLAESLEREKATGKLLEERNRALTEAHAQINEALEQQTATSEILRAIASSPTEYQPVFDTIVRNAGVVCGAVDALLWTIDGDELVVRAHHGPLAAAIGARQPVLGSVAGYAVRQARVVHVDDLTEADDFPVGRDLARRLGWRTTLSAPLLREGAAIGAILIRRSEMRPFSDQQVALLQTFADQAVIAIENVRLFNETKEALEQQTATSEILRVISQSPTDVQPVFDAIVRSAVRLCNAMFGSVFKYDGTLLHFVAGHQLTEEALGLLQEVYPIAPRGVNRRVIVDREPVNVADALNDPRVANLELIRRLGYRSQLAVPMLQAGKAIGTINVYGAEPGPFSDGEVGLLKTFADQAVIAIENVRLFNETKEALEQQTATSEILRVIASSPTDVQPVFDTIVTNAASLCEASNTAVCLARDGFLHLDAVHLVSMTPEGIEGVQRRFPMPITPHIAQTLRGQTFHIADIAHNPAAPEAMKTLARRGGYESMVWVPLMRGDEGVGLLSVTRATPRPFDDNQIAVLRNFAHQAVIAIENVRLFRELADKSQQLEAASRHKSEFLANMSHELRTPLNAIIGYSELLEEEAGELEGGWLVPDLQKIATAAKHQLSLINDILDLSKVEAGRMELELSDFDVTTTLDSALTLVRERAGRRGIALQVEVDSRLGPLRADERKVRQVVLNLLSNAIKFTPEGGGIEVRATRTDGSVEVSVSDTGIGIAPEDQEKVFEEFRQVGTADKKVEGTGLGLALARKFVELHGGRIWVKSEVGRGSTFTFSLPVGGGG